MNYRFSIILILITIISFNCSNSDTVDIASVEESLEKKAQQMLNEIKEFKEQGIHKAFPYFFHADFVTNKSIRLIQNLDLLKSSEKNIINFKDELKLYIEITKEVYSCGITDQEYQPILDKIIIEFNDYQYIKFKELIKNKIILNNYYTINDLYLSIRKDKYQFNVLEPVIKEKKNELNKGEIYEAKIMVAAFDTNYFPEIYIKSESDKNEISYDQIPIEFGRGIYKTKAHRKGENRYEGFIKYVFDINDTIILNFENSFTVK